MRKVMVTALLLLLSAGGAFSQTTLPDTLSGSVKGTTKPNHTYVVKDSLTINAGDTLTISQGDTLLMENDAATGAACWIHILGSFICNGTAADRNLITTAETDSAKHPGMWGGIVGDSCKFVSVTFTNITWAGGDNASGHAYRTFDIYSDFANTTTTVFTDNLVVGTVDDCIGLHGGNASILRNVIKWCGAPDGDNINVKSGTIGEIAYNVIWASGGNGIKLNADPSLPRLTNMCVHNNTIVAGGWRRVDELGYAVLVDNSARAEIYNNIMGDMYEELEITVAADTLRTVYNNNLFFYSVDSLGGMSRYYPADGVGKAAPNDIFNVKAADLFKSYQPFFSNNWIALDGNNDYRVLSSSPAAGAGWTPPAPTASNHWGNPYFGNGTQTLPGDKNIGALGVYTQTAVKSRTSTVPSAFALAQNFPNPFNPTTTVNVSLAKGGVASLKVYNVLGQLVKIVDEGYKPAGSYSYQINMDNFSSGVYFYTLQEGSSRLTRKMILMK